MRFISTAILCSALVTPAACGDDDKAAGDTTSGDTTPDTAQPDAAQPDTAQPDTAQPDTAQPDTTPGPTTYGARLAASYCAYIDNCYPYDTAENVYVMLARQGSNAECVAFIGALLGAFDLDAGIADGRYTVDEARLSACIDGISTQCVSDASLVCRDMLEGKVALGGECERSEDCAGDAFCDADFGCGGVCAARGAAGAECDDHDECSTADARLGCNYDSFMCVPVSSADNATLGAPCGEVFGEGSLTMTRCAAGLACELGECQAIVAAGEPCEGDRTPCEIGTVCYPDGPESETASCRAFPLVSTVGATCKEEYGAEGAMFCNPVKRLGCIDGKCAEAGDGSIGSRCFAGADRVPYCDAGNYCNAATNLCAAALADGAACQGDDDCVSGYCDFVGGDSGTCSSSCD